jgi:predicted AAA+ superfamily ATPase
MHRPDAKPTISDTAVRSMATGRQAGRGPSQVLEPIMKPLKALCRPRPSVFDPSKRDTVLDITDLIDHKINAREFFVENHVTDGMRTLLVEGFRRLEGKSSQGVFKLTQAMGGGKTHSMLALGLLAEDPELREPVMGDIYRPVGLGRVRVVGFSGRESDAPLGIWGEIAGQLGKKDLFKEYYSPLQAPGQKAWINLLKGDPTLILLDELPPYLVNAKSKAIGNSDLAQVTATALSNLLVAVGKGELANVCVVLSDLTGSYAEGVERIASILNDLSKETDRSAMNLEPVRINTDEFYHILRKRVFEEPPPESEIAALAQAYAKAVRDGGCPVRS